MAYNSVEEYRDCKINWGYCENQRYRILERNSTSHVRNEDNTAAIVRCRSCLGIPERSSSENEARELILKLAREFVDNRIRI